MNKKTDLLRTILFFSWMWFVLLLTVLLLIPLPILSLKPLTSIRKKYIYGITTFWARHLNSCSGSKISVNGMENCPSQGGFCIIANHSSNFDIPLLLSAIPRSIGFIGKKEMKKIPFLNTWMKTIGSVFIDRNNIKDSIKGLKKAVKNMEDNIPMALFPEGTRSRTGKPGTFHKAGLKLVQRQGIPFLPVSIIGAWGMFEKQNRIIPREVQINIHPPCFDRNEAIDLILQDLKETYT